MSEQTTIDPHSLLAYQRRLLAAAMGAMGRLLLVAGAILLLAGLLGNWDSGAFRALVIVLSLAVLVPGVGLAVADDYLPKLPGSAASEPTNVAPADPTGG